MILFKKIKYKNFLSSGNMPVEIDLNKANTTLVVGINGSGKSTLLDALCFALFNKPFRIIKKEQMVNTINNGDTIVELDFEVGTKSYKIIRGIKPNIFEIYCDGERIDQHANVVDYQKYLEKNIMKLNYRSFIQVVILGSSSYEPFMKMKPRYRREVVEEILDIRVFGLMDLLLRSQQSDLQKKVVETRHQADLIATRYETEAKYLKSLQTKDIDVQTHKQKLIQKNEQDRLNYVKKMDELNNQIEATKTRLIDRPKTDEKVNQLAKLEAKIETNLLNHKNSLEFFEDNDNCPTCTQSLTPEFKKQKMLEEQEKVDTLEKGLKDLLNEIVKTETKVNEFNAISDKITELNLDVAKIQTSLDGIRQQTDNIHQELNIFTNGGETDIEKIQDELRKMKINLDKAKLDLEEVQEEKGYVDVLREVLNDKGAKAKIIKKYLPIMNQLVNKYLQAMDFFVSFNLDEEFNETVKSRFRDEFNYNNFSEGEKMRIDLALLFTWRDIARMKNSTNTNILVLDEIFDSSLDGQGTDDFLKILKTFQKENVFIISHKGDIMFDKFNDVIKFEKEHNFTRLANA